MPLSSGALVYTATSSCADLGWRPITRTRQHWPAKLPSSAGLDQGCRDSCPTPFAATAGTVEISDGKVGTLRRLFAERHAGLPASFHTNVEAPELPITLRGLHRTSSLLILTIEPCRPWSLTQSKPNNNVRAACTSRFTCARLGNLKCNRSLPSMQLAGLES